MIKVTVGTELFAKWYMYVYPCHPLLNSFVGWFNMLNLNQNYLMVKKNIFSIILALIILYLSLASSDTFDRVSIFNIPFFDKIVHFCMYFGFMSIIIWENRKSLTNSRRLWLTAIVPLTFGVLMEILQATVTTSRSASLADIFFNFSGILISLFIWLLIKPYIRI